MDQSLVITNFISDVKSGTAPLEVQFINTSTGPWVNCAWNFGDGSTSSVVNPPHKFDESGLYNVELTVYDMDGAEHKFNETITVVKESKSRLQQSTLTIFKYLPEDYIGSQTIKSKGVLFASEGPFGSDGSVEGQNYAETGVISGSCLSGGSPAYVGIAAGIGSTYSILGSGAFEDESAPHVIINAPTYAGNQSYTGWNDIFVSPTFGPQCWWTWMTQLTASNPLKPAWALHRVTLEGGKINIGPTAEAGDYAFPSLQIKKSSWRMSNIVDKNWEGSGYSHVFSQKRVGTKKKLHTTDVDDKEICLIYPHSSLTSLYSATSIYPGTTRVNIPWVLWHESSNASSGSVGVTMVDDGLTFKSPEGGERFGYLRDTVSNRELGKAYYDYKSIMITDPELAAVCSYNSNRSYTLPAPSVNFVEPVGAQVGWTKKDIDYYVTYGPVLSGNDVDGHYTTSAASVIHCRDIQKISEINSSPRAIRVVVPQNKWYREDTSDGQGFNAKQYDIFMATGTSSTIPTSDKWKKVYDGLTISTGGSSSIVLDSTYNINVGSTYTLPVANSGTSTYSVGREHWFLGYVSGYTESKVKRLSVAIVADRHEFNKTQNPTWSGSTDDGVGVHVDTDLTQDVWFSEIGLYDDDNNLLVIGKLSPPIKKNAYEIVNMRVNVDF